jgi:glucose/mannose-6-phosphate isomerase
LIYQDIKNFPKQFEYKPVVEGGNLESFDRFVVVGMGGSNLAADLVKILRPDLDIVVHRDYGLPNYLDKKALVVLSSYSGNTEEVIDVYRAAGEQGFKRLAISADGELLKLARSEGAPYIKFPGEKIQPRVALGWSFLALLRAIGDEKLLGEAQSLSGALDPAALDGEGERLAGKLQGAVPIVYASNRNKGLSYVWKIVLNETAKTPAFANVFPELNHNEMTGFSSEGEKFYFIFLEDKDDHPRVIKRAAVTREMLKNKGFKVERVEIAGGSGLGKIFNSALLAHFTGYHLARARGAEPEEVPMVEEFKGLIQKLEPEGE